MSKARDLADSVAAGSVLADGVVSLSEVGGGTNNGVVFVNGSGTTGSGSALTFDGTNFANTLSANASAGIRVINSNAGTSASTNTSYSNGTNSHEFGILGTGYTTYGVLAAGDAYIYAGAAKNISLMADGNGAIKFGVGAGGPEKMRLTSTGLGIGTSSPTQKLEVAGAIAATGQAPALTASSAFFDYIPSINSGRYAVVGNTTGATGSIIFSQYSSNGSVGRDAMTLDSSGELTTTNGKFNLITVGRGAGAVATNTAVGASALAANSTSTFSTAVGYQALTSNTTATGYNTALGGRTLYSNTTGQLNTAAGESALYFNTTGSSNTAFGEESLKSNTTASNNTAVGYQAGYSNTTGTGVTYVGHLAGAGKTGNYNTAVGKNSLTAAGAGAQNTGVGYDSVQGTTSGASNSGIGFQSLYQNTTGSSNTAVGALSGFNNTTGTFNTFVGEYSGYSHTTGVWNTCIGKNSGYALTTGSKNTIIGGFNGNQGGLDIRTANNFIVLSDGDGNPRGIFDSSGNFLVGTTSADGALTQNAIVVRKSNGSLQVHHENGNTGSNFADFGYSGSSIGTISQNSTVTVGYNTSSDYRLKNTIAPMTGALAKVALLKPVTYKWNADGSDGQGFIAHELAEIVPECVNGEKDAVDADGNPVYQGIDTSFLVATLTAAIQEQQAIIEALTARISALEGN